MRKGLLFIIIFFVFIGILSTGCKENIRLVAGGYTEGDEQGISVFKLNVKKSKPELMLQCDAGPNPSFFAFSNDNNLIYCINEVMEFNGKTGGGLTTLKYDKKNGEYKKAGELTVPYGGPCHISVSSDGKYLFIANYGSASIAVVKTDKSGIPETVTDTIIYETDSTEVSHPHMIMQDPKAKHVYVSDLGLDRIMIYNFDAGTGLLHQSDNGIVNITKGSGPRHFAFNADGSVMYLINELGSTMMVFEIDEKGGLSLKQTISTLAEEFQGRSFCADVHLSPDGKFLYGSNRGENTIVIFNIDKDGFLTPGGNVSCGGNWPRNFVIDNTGKYLLVANQRSDQISVFTINKNTGILDGPPTQISLSTPACLKFLN